MKTRIVHLVHLIAVSALFGGPRICIAGENASNSPDFQIRLPLHLQFVPEWNISARNSGDAKLGIAAWGVFPNAMAEGNHSANILIAGPLLEHGKGNWVELMMGGLQSHSNSDFLIDLRFSEKISPQLTISGELGYFPEEENRRLYTFLIADTPVTFGKYTMRMGLETENIFFAGSKRDSLGIGPRIAFPIPQKVPPGLSTAFVVAYQFRNDKDFLRCYLTFTYRLGQKR